METKINDKICKTLYEKIDGYPKYCSPIRYPKPSFSNRVTFHDMILSNMNALVPSVDMAIYTRYDQSEIELWINKTKEYANAINQNIQNKCDGQLSKIRAIKEREQKSKDFDMKKMDNLPEDIIRYVHDFLLPETRIQLLIARYPFYMTNLNKITCVNLKKYLACVYSKYVKTAMCYNSKFQDRYLCITDFTGFSVNFARKEIGLDQLSNVFHALTTAIPKTPGYHRYFQKKALKLLQSLIYIGVYRINDVRHNK